MAFPADGYNVSAVDLQCQAGDLSYSMTIVFDGEVVSEQFLADVGTAIERAVAVARPGEPVDSSVTYTGRRPA